MRVGEEILALARARGARTVFVVGTGKGVGKSTALGAIYAAAVRDGIDVGIAATGPTPPLRLAPGTLFATARRFLPSSPASEIVELSQLESASGALLCGRVASAATIELTGPSTASGFHAMLDACFGRCDLVLVDGAIDRIAALAGSDGAIVIACGAAAAKTPSQAAEDAGALAARLRLPVYDPQEESLALEGALGATRAAELIAARETRQIVVRDPTQLVMDARPLAHALASLRLRCRRPLHAIAATVNAFSPERSFDPRGFLDAVGAATELPAFDVFAGAQAA